MAHRERRYTLAELQAMGAKLPSSPSATSAPVASGTTIRIEPRKAVAQSAYVPPTEPARAGFEERQGRFGAYQTLTVVEAGDGGRYVRLSIGKNSMASALVRFLSSLSPADLAKIIGE